MSDEQILAELDEKLPYSDSEEDVAKRANYWSSIDVNGNRYISLAETDKGLRDVIRIPELFDTKPVIIRAFNAAKTALKASSKYGDDYVSKAEFKYLLRYLRQYYEYWLMFDKIDTSEDRRVSPKEFGAAVPLLKKWGVDAGDPEAVFAEIDANNGGFVLFYEFCEWAIRKSVSIDDSE